MKRFLLVFLSACMLSVCGSAGNYVKCQPSATVGYMVGVSRAAATIDMSKCVAAIYDTGYETPGYYLILSDSQDASYNMNTGVESVPDGHYALVLDLYHNATTPVQLPIGTYYPRNDVNGYGASTYDSEYTMLNYYSDGHASSITITDPVEVTCDDSGIYTISTVVRNPDSTGAVDVVYTGRINMMNVNEKPSVYPQISENISDIALDYGGVAFYQGVTDYSRNGVTMLNLYSVAASDDGVMSDDGWNLCMMIAHKRFTRRDSYNVVPGTYVSATNLARDTWYPCREIDYNYGGTVVTLPFGSYIRKRENGNYTYAYLKEGTFTIMQDAEGNFYGSLDAVTDLGYTVTLTWKGKIVLNTENAQFQATVSNLTDDVALDFTKIDKGRIYHRGIVGGCRTFVVDLGSPSGRDSGINYGGDLLRMEFFAPQNTAVLQSGLYTVVPDRWNANELAGGGTYEPYSLNKGYFSSTGGSDGTRYAHFKDGSYCVEDLHGPVEEGTVRVTTTDFQNYHFEIELFDDAGFKIYGTYDGPIEYNYNREALENELSGLENIGVGDTEISVVLKDNNLTVLNAGNAKVRIYNISGMLVADTTAENTIDVSGLSSGIYILSVKNKAIKIVIR